MLAMDSRGEGTPVVLLHSSGMSRRQWRRLAVELSARHAVHSLDFLGSGENPPWPAGAPFDFHLDVAAVAEVVRAQQGPVHLVGHSYGGLIALTLAREQPALVRSIAVYDPVAFGVLYGEPVAEASVADLAEAAQQPAFRAGEKGGEAWLERFVDYWTGPGAWRAMPEASRAEFLRVGSQVYAEVHSLLADRTPAHAYASITAPALLLGGERTPSAARQVLARLALALPSARLEAIPGAGHMGPLTHGAEVCAAIAAHLFSAEASSPALRA
jgi:pimeloyl-ACP methyl ester carboxylesterase